ncbi:amidohydrolase family protein [Sorangium sp. So ce260]|uniref:amidohydrolase family protein n=1 Tax=Sorangium sp. So ce260 TaxID=3133291 RepID=UPI003F5EBEBC
MAGRRHPHAGLGRVLLRARVVDVGDADRITREARPGAVTIDLGGDSLAPGFVEAHAHIVAATQTTYSVDLRHSPELDTYEKVLDRIAREIAQLPAGAWRFFMNFDPSLLAFDRALGFPQLGFDVLDALPNSQNVNIFVENASGHIAYGNSRAFEWIDLAGIQDAGEQGLSAGAAHPLHTRSDDRLRRTLPRESAPSPRP